MPSVCHFRHISLWLHTCTYSLDSDIDHGRLCLNKTVLCVTEDDFSAFIYFRVTLDNRVTLVSSVRAQCFVCSDYSVFMWFSFTHFFNNFIYSFFLWVYYNKLINSGIIFVSPDLSFDKEWRASCSWRDYTLQVNCWQVSGTRPPLNLD